MDISDWTITLVEVFPGLSGETIEIVAPNSKWYNCISYAAGDVSEWWDILEGDYFWPDFATRSRSIESLIEVFVGLGFQQCQDSSLESSYEKVALYEEQGVWKHAALQTPTGRWRSKMGQGPVIEHLSPESLCDGIYGNPTVFMRRPANHVTIFE